MKKKFRKLSHNAGERLGKIEAVWFRTKPIAEQDSSSAGVRRNK